MSIKDWFYKKPGNENSDTDSKDRGCNFSQNNRPVLSVDEIALGMQHAAMAANRLIARQYLQAMEPFFEDIGDGRLKPKVVDIELDNDHQIKIPLVAMSTPRGLLLEKMKVFLTVCTEAIEPMDVSTNSTEETTNRFIVSLSPTAHDKNGRSPSHVDIEMEFRSFEPPESVMRLIEEYTRHIQPIRQL
ncbi:DUF2589 domain-containing protein [Ochrobactrum sp. Q0168]|uniref:DUF2589 domain-containing protein n=1 Tax=Ochrobactrum sp. Q0168 TaxID=2793241 RepID=UPI0018EB5EB1|nr:DUF2589 domain-containing protein [Ochrobactrum sp. Q0168]